MSLSRREFFRLSAGCFVATASLVSLSGCGRPRASEGSYTFPQGIASGDPGPDSVILWTRSVADGRGVEAIDLTVQVSRDEAFSDIILEQEVVADRAFDYTVRCLIDGLEANRHYFYRFLAPDQTASRIGRTRTAPEEDSDTQLVVAVCSCQHYLRGLFGAYRRLLVDDEVAPDDRKIDLIIHVGDFIYEGIGAGEAELSNRDGSPRVISALPSGGRGAVTLDDYRHVYHTYLSDPDLQEARARFPWVVSWDDHEVTNDYWQSYTQSGEPMQKRKLAANQAWFEVMPAALTLAQEGPAGFNPARDFGLSDVEDASVISFDDDYLSQEDNNLTAVGSMTIYRSLKSGRLVDLLIVDGRSYRGPRGVASDVLGSENIAYPNAPVSAAFVRTLNAGRTANNGDPPETVEFQGGQIPNSRREAPRASLLGAEQKAWLKDSLQQSQTRWRVICNNVPLMRFGFDVSFRDTGRVNDLWWTDSWDGYPIERNELMSFIRDNGITNVVSVTGDRHAHFAGLVHDDFDSVTPSAVIPEFAGAGISAFCRALQNMEDPELDALMRFDGTEFGFDQGVMPALNAWLLFGAAAARRLSDTGDAVRAMEAENDRVNPHLAYADTMAWGYFVTRFSSDAIETEFVTVAEPREDFGDGGPPVQRRVSFSVPAWSQGETPGLRITGIEGTPPLMGLKQGTDTL